MTDQSPRDKARSLLLKSATRRTETVDCGNGLTIEIRQATVGVRSKIMSFAGMTASGNIKDIGKMQLASVIECAYCAESGEKLFDWNDENVLGALPTATWFDEASNLAMNMMHKEAADAGNASSETTNG